jgi:hypothetical protein
MGRFGASPPFLDGVDLRQELIEARKRTLKGLLKRPHAHF